MDVMGERKIIGYVVFFVIALVTVISPIYILLNREDVKGVDIQRDITTPHPYITNLMPKSAYVGEEYIFVPRVVANDFGNVVLTIEEGPSWLYIDEGYIIRGYPSSSDIGTVKVTLKVDDGMGSSTISEYIIVTEDEE
ncbi:hypothetical protein CVU76_00570 [Candidatus Dojkabacteria bacterium HGW-Dojkabacteria-1]|uniref:Dystroglycan-type cadherin-like domain-containing protein n=1 Tax=Candidatus Dojkabacteria bacterium HGW-Dojkabacteria-1 TaxID=2013761 RepID=A0A2N2F2Y4_9BACT|nr:MAG: hypothetical protein CVU76_00570 [Candidatus Dojkabacteria bacterium HGW-Dojkabacteria-1]